MFDQGKLLKQSCFTGNIKQLVIRTFLISHKMFNIKNQLLALCNFYNLCVVATLKIHTKEVDSTGNPMFSIEMQKKIKNKLL